MEAVESLLIPISDHFQQFHSSFDFEVHISLESGKRKLGTDFFFLKGGGDGVALPLKPLIIKEH